MDIRLSLFTENIIVYVGKPREFTEILLESIREFNKVSGNRKIHCISTY